METPLLAAALIVKNEEGNLPGCLEALNALRPLLGEICVYDTGSDDRTIEIAEAAGASVERGFWDGDFARARNEAIAMCTAKWVFIVDADERVYADRDRLAYELRRALTDGMLGQDALDVTVRDVRNGDEDLAWVSTRLLRPSRARYEGRVHEQVISLRTRQRGKNPEIRPAIVTVRHLGYADEARVEAKMSRNADLAELQIAACENDPARHEELIRALVDRARSIAAWGRRADAIADLERVRGMRSGYTYRWWGMQQLADMLIDDGEHERALEIAEQLRTEGAEPSYSDWLMARSLLAQGHIPEGLARLRLIDKLVSAIGSVSPAHMLLEARMSAAILAEQFDEALACVIPLMAGWGHITGYGRVLLRLWGSRPVDLLVEFLKECDKGHLPAIADELRGCADPGPQIAELLCAPVLSARR